MNDIFNESFNIYLMSNPLLNIQYGLFVITTCDGGRDNGCISNTVEQVTSQPNRLSVSLSKENYTTELIQRSGRFTVSVISEEADFELFKHFGMPTPCPILTMYSLVVRCGGMTCSTCISGK